MSFFVTFSSHSEVEIITMNKYPVRISWWQDALIRLASFSDAAAEGEQRSR
jgi:hypothetical protein